MRILPLLVPVLLLVSTADASSAGQRVVVGGPTAKRLYRVACEADAGPWLKDFSEEHFTLLGTVTSNDGTRFQLGFLSTIWGQAGRATNRLLVFSNQGSYLGRYNGFSSSEPPAIVSSGVVKFPVAAKHGNEASFNAGPPGAIRTDGVLREYEPATGTPRQTDCGNL